VYQPFLNTRLKAVVAALAVSEASVFPGLIEVLEAAGQLKQTQRAGWVRVGIAHPESVAAHSYRVAVLALLLGPRLGLNVEKLLRLALLHDLPEARVGDLTPADRVTPRDKHALESTAFAEIVGGLPEGPALDALWREYAANASPEARLVHQLDKLEMALQALEYERATSGTSKAVSGKSEVQSEETGARNQESVGESQEPGDETNRRWRRRRGGRTASRTAAGWADEFWASARAALSEPLLIALYEHLSALRPPR